MKYHQWLAIAFIGLPLLATANDMSKSFNEAREVGKSSNSNAQSILRGFQPSKEFDNFQARPAESGHYQGITGNPDLNGKGMQALSNSEIGKSIRESTINNPKVNISEESDFIQNSNHIRKNADVISGMANSKQCVNQVLSKSVFSNHFCEKDNHTEQECVNTANVEWKKETVLEKKAYVIQPNEIEYNYVPQPTNVRGLSCLSSHLTFTFNAPQKGKVLGYRITHHGLQNDKSLTEYYVMDLFNEEKKFKLFGSKDIALDDITFPVNKNEVIKGNLFAQGGYTIKGSIPYCLVPEREGKTRRGFMKQLNLQNHLNAFRDGREKLFITVIMLAEIEKNKAEIKWNEVCPIDFTSAISIGKQCIQKGETRTFQKDGETHSLYSDCWQTKEKYIVNDASDNECRRYEQDNNCTISERECILKMGNNCIRQRVKYQCSKTVKTEGYVCGDKFFCSDGSCSDLEGAVNSDFGHAVSQLATLAQAGKDVSLDEVKLRAFSGRPMFCRKSGFGFSDCCKDSGWGHKAGLAQCNSEENALGQAKEKKLVIFVGTYCDKRVLKKCVRRKSSYCVFDNKLARIIQAQGRSGQLGLGFGGASSPDCRGLNVEELQRIDFNAMDYSDFYEELEANKQIPDKDQLIEYMRKSITDQLQQ